MNLEDESKFSIFENEETSNSCLVKVQTYDEHSFIKTNLSGLQHFFKPFWLQPTIRNTFYITTSCRYICTCHIRDKCKFHKIIPLLHGIFHLIPSISVFNEVSDPLNWFQGWLIEGLLLLMISSYPLKLGEKANFMKVGKLRHIIVT